MAERKTDEQKLAELEKKLQQIQAQKKAIIARTHEKERKDRTRRLIENGALAEKYLQAQNISPTEFEKILSQLVQIEQVKNIISTAANTQRDGILSD